MADELDEAFARSPFPDGRWGSTTSPLTPLLHRFAASPVGSATIRRLVPLDRRLLRRSGGRYTVLGPFGSPMLLLTATGASSGLPRTTPLVYLPDGDALIVVGSNFGQGHHPAWVANLAAHPDATVAIRGRTFAVRAIELEGAARAEAFARFEALAKPYQAYAARTDRTIRVFALHAREA
jgi:deazaflavin-dependent oxidoreductase (nitroreductase family)